MAAPLSEFHHAVVESMVHGGDGLCRINGQACFVPGVIPGETVRVTPIEQHPGFVRARLEDIITPAPDRCTPPCPVFGLCGGCHWQHMAYARQLLCKQAIVIDCLHRIGKVHQCAVAPVVPSPDIWGYRSRVQLQVGQHDKIGFYRPRTHRIVPITHCPLLMPLLNEALAWYRTEMRRLQVPSGTQQVDMLALPQSGAVLISWRDKRARVLRSNRWAANGQLHDCGSQPLHEQIGGLDCVRSPGNFYQVNIGQNIQMIDAVCAAMQPLSGKRICDLFCGSGNFSLPLARGNAVIRGIESNARAIAEARKNAAINAIDGATFSIADIMGAAPGLDLDPCDGVVVNPPRSGCTPETLALIERLHPAVIVYVSCNPATLARDLGRLTQADFAIRHIQPFDMFPQTFHIETIAILDRKGSMP